MERPLVVIPSRGRWQGARKLTQAWHKEGFDVAWMVEPDESDIYWNAIIGSAPITGPPNTDPPSTYISVLSKPNAGISHSRNKCVQYAADNGYKSFILADDDIKPSSKGSNILSLVEMAKHSKVMGITARYSYHDLCLGEAFKDFKQNKVILNPGGTFRLVALNIQNVLELGNYDTNLQYAEDCDLFLRSLQAGFPWMLHAGTWSNSIGTRYQPGGMLDFVGEQNLAKAKGLWHEDIHAKWPDFTNEHKPSVCAGKQNCIRFQWKRAYDHFLPDWKKWSHLHGGSLKEYINV